MTAPQASAHAAALAGWDAGLSMLLVREDGSKQPGGIRIWKWKRRQTRRCSRRALDRIYRERGLSGVGFATGAVSGHVRLFEFDCAATYAIFLEAADGIGLGDLVARIRGGYEESTPGGGLHWLVRCPVEGGNTKLASRPAPTEANPNAVKTLIETREDGGYVIVAPSNGRVHETGDAYELISGGFNTIAEITPEDWQDLRALALGFDQMPERVKPNGRQRTGAEPTSDSPGSIFNERASWAEVLEPRGWTWVYEQGGTDYWRRPGKNRGHSATTNSKGTDTFHCFSSSVAGFELSPSSCDKFGAYTRLNHGGDFSAAGKALYAAGYQKAEPDAAIGDAGYTEPPAEPRTLAEVVETFQRWLYLPDPGLVHVVLATVAANYAEGDPLWLMVVAASSSGKTEVLNAVSGLRDVHMAATMTESALLSGTPKRDKASGAKGGLLREIGDFGILCAKDFTSVLSMARDPRAALLAALREIYDGSWDRHVGVDGGRTLSWRGKIGMVAGCTAAWDGHHTVTATMGERFLLHRPPEVNPRKQARRALANTGKEAQLRAELAAAVHGLFAGLDIPDAPPELDEDEIDRLVALGSLVARCRSAVERDGRTREIELILDAEAPARITQALRRLYGGLLMIGLPAAEAWPLVTKTGLDCMPKIRRAVFEVLAHTDEAVETSRIATTVGYPTKTAHRALEDLGVHRIIERRSGGKGKPDVWRLSTWARAQYVAATGTEKSVDTEGDGVDRDGDAPLNKATSIVSDFSVPLGDERQPHCWQCRAALDGSRADTCGSCGWLVCACGACAEDCDGSEEPETDESEESERACVRCGGRVGSARTAATCLKCAADGAV